MNMNQYLEQSGRTAAAVLHSEKVHPGHALKWLANFNVAAAALDQVKKCVFYARDTLMHTWRETQHREGAIDGMDMDTLHALLGVMTEAGELGELLEEAIITGNPIDRTKLIDESGDILWYLAMLFRKLDTTFEEVGEKNIKKLMVRFPDKFTFDAVNNKNHAAEHEVFDDGA